MARVTHIARTERSHKSYLSHKWRLAGWRWRQEEAAVKPQ